MNISKGNKTTRKILKKEFSVHNAAGKHPQYAMQSEYSEMNMWVIVCSLLQELYLNFYHIFNMQHSRMWIKDMIFITDASNGIAFNLPDHFYIYTSKRE